ncbi:hypothetical protein BC835DRAFT_1327238 [Cytidiella melzeri]|nr:hypothetical protein BC835DRAFT_1327238 [Cytidiella melzeri]
MTRSRKQAGSWRASPSPERVAATQSRTRKIDNILSEEHDAWGRKKLVATCLVLICRVSDLPQVQWSGWQDEDGLNTTWEYLNYDDVDAADAIDEWEAAIARKRKHLARKGLEMPIPDGRVPLYDYQTFEDAHAFEQKQRRSRKLSLSRFANWDALSDSTRGEPSTSVPHIDSRESLRVVTVRSAHAPTQVEEDSLQPMLHRRRSPNRPEHPSKRRKTEDAPERLNSQSGRQHSIEFRWKAVCRASKAADISIANSVTRESMPPLPPHFRYVEGKYLLPENVAPPDPGFLVACDCAMGCEDAELCDCQESAAADHHGRKTFAYDSVGRYKFDRDGVIIECSKSCFCSGTCPNKVAQHPRDVPIQVFRTENRGWGVRATIDLVRGRFVGLYAGRRDHADALRGEHRSYIFDLDAIETDDDSEDMERYSVDAYQQGSWTRFINHSCEPNMEVHSVVWDTPLSMNRPYLAFFATKHIAAFTELTIDYDPRAARDGKRVARQSDKVCMCGAPSCRGHLSV